MSNILDSKDYNDPNSVLFRGVLNKSSSKSKKSTTGGIFIHYRTFGNYNEIINLYVIYRNGSLVNADSQKYRGNDPFVIKVRKDLDNLKNDDRELKRRLNVLENSSHIHNIKSITYGPNITEAEDDTKADNNIPTGSTVYYNPNEEYEYFTDYKRNPRVALAHELLGHSYDINQGLEQLEENEDGFPIDEINAINVENLSRAKTGDPQRNWYDGREIPEKYLKRPDAK